MNTVQLLAAVHHLEARVADALASGEALLRDVKQTRRHNGGAR